MKCLIGKAEDGSKDNVGYSILVEGCRSEEGDRDVFFFFFFKQKTAYDV